MMGELETEHVERLVTALEHERITGPVRAAHFAGERAYQIARTQGARAGQTRVLGRLFHRPGGGSSGSRLGRMGRSEESRR